MNKKAGESPGADVADAAPRVGRRRVLQGALGAGAWAFAARDTIAQPRPVAPASGDFAEARRSLQGSPRHALVIGNSGYKDAPLRNPANDANAVAALLKGVGFDVVHAIDANRAAMLEAIESYVATLAQKGSIGLFYFAGHGVQLAWRNFLVPVDAVVDSPDDVRDRTVNLNALIQGLTRAKNPMNVIILDACRDNPFGSRYTGGQKGLSPFDAPTGSIVAYSTAPGNVASDGDGEHGLYTENLLREIRVPEAKIEDVFKRVRLHVRRRTRGQQIPWESTSLEEDFYFIPPKAVERLGEGEHRRGFMLRVSQLAQLGRPAPQGDRTLDRLFEEQLAAWEKLQHVQDPEPLVEFLLRYPSGWFSELAELRLDQLLERQGEKKVVARSAPDNPYFKGFSSMNTAYRIGDSYTFREFDMLTREPTGSISTTVVKITETEIFYDDGRVSDLLGNILVAPGRFTRSHNQLIPREFSVGKRWSTRFKVIAANGNQSVADFAVRIADREQVTVPAGTFNAFRVEAKGWAQGPSVNLHQEVTRWYAPDQVRHPVAVEAFIRRQDGSIQISRRTELTSFRQQIPPK